MGTPPSIVSQPCAGGTRTEGEEMNMKYAKYLNNDALADRLRRMVADPGRWPRREREAFILEAADRLEKIK
jgi:hypothetical protein